MFPHIHLYVLASGSKGNAAVVEGPTGSILIDCGLSRKALHARADEVGCDLDRVSAILVTHEHGDHTTGLPVISRHFDGPIFTTVGTATGRKSLSDIRFTLIDHDDTGHLSNEQAAEALPHLVTHDTETVIALHLSQQNNRPSLAVRALAQAVSAEKTNDTFTEARTKDGLLTICAGSQDKPLRVW